MARAQTGQPLLIQVLSLYLLLLAFFVVLTHLSKAEQDRSMAVSGSVSETFSSAGRPADAAASFTASLGSVLADSGITETLGSLVRTELSFARVRHIVPGTVMEATVAADRLFVPGSGRIDPRYRRFVERLAAVLAQPRGGARLDLEIAAGIAHAAPPDGPAARLAAERSAFLAEVLSVAGAPARNLAGGVEPGLADMVRLLFHVRPETEPGPSFGGDRP
jgi:hypothetical protein